jgi:Cellulase (glycosyl hydrolase family 5)
MRPSSISLRRHGYVAVLAAISLVAAHPSDGASPPPGSFQTAIVDQAAFSGLDSAAELQRVYDAGATMVRLVLRWGAVAPTSPADGFRADDPADEQYDWTSIDQQVRNATEQGLEPIVDIFDAPRWATARASVGGPYKPDPRKLAQFAKAVARRYRGDFEDLPRVQFWQLWNEPNLAWSLRPQFEGKKLVSPSVYRGMLNAFATAVHSVRSTNSVVAGGTAPFTSRFGERSRWGPGPLLFMRELLCLSKSLRPTCAQRAIFDIWAHHPYTSGGPSHRANIADDVSLGDLPRMRAVLDAAVRLNHVVSKQKVRFWVTEFSWDTSPPDPNAMPLALQTRWISEAFYAMWKSGVSLATWYLIEDEPLAKSPYQSGLYFNGGKKKPSFRAFRFPFVAFSRDSGILVWGRTPWSKAGTVIVEQRSGQTWKRLGSLRTNPRGVFSTRYRSRGTGPLRARLLGSPGDTSVPFSLKEPPDLVVRPFGER